MTSKINPAYAERVLREFEEHPEHFRTINKSRRQVRRGENIQPSVPDVIEYRNIHGRDQKLIFPPSLLLAWGSPKRVHLFVTGDGMVILKKVSDDARGTGVYTVSQAKPHHQGSITTTWKGVGFQPPESSDATRSAHALPCFLKGDKLLIDYSELRRM